MVWDVPDPQVGEHVSAADVRLWEAWNGTKTACARVSVKAAEKVAESTIKVKYTSCVVRLVQPRAKKQLRCYKCLEIGHVRAACKSEVDRSACCIRCGKPDHQAKNCTAEVCSAVCNGPHHVGHPTCRR
ncbi:uncharacterized protein LOC128716747 [Anopheles marshallii]|uniref:uncharacterized protein LOC128716747 n=1 Tax=Anopheles marshallii TaxID=1521116 RepID=UPI00237C4B4B|nr:uncharacterized protein LOC128716747 [Anopheles marshallii]